jgi:L-alanine-DL-glutamate epimerase-like enolase superfamily enzyme
LPQTSGTWTERALAVRVERWPIAVPFRISRGAKTEAVVVVAEVREGEDLGRGECVPYARYGETAESVTAAIRSAGAAIADGVDRTRLQSLMPPGAARNALDCALWDLESKQAGRRAWELAGLPAPQPATSAYTLSLDTPEAMAKAAGTYPLLKLKLGAPGDEARLAAVRAARPDATLIVDANEGWRTENVAAMLRACAVAGVALVEQPLPAGDDAALATIPRPVPVCADESVHHRGDLAGLRGKYDAVNIKLDKAGGLTEALALADAAEREGFAIMIGCMVSTSLAIAPALLLAARARFIDLDGPLLLERDRPEGLRYSGTLLYPPTVALWG